MRKSDAQNLFFKILIMGDRKVGKSAITRILSDGEYSDIVEKTDFYVKRVIINGISHIIQLWDIFSYKLNSNLTQALLLNSDIVIIAYDITNRSTFDDIYNLLDYIEQYSNTESKLIMVGNKTDLSAIRQVSQQEGKELAESLGILFSEMSCLENNKLQSKIHEICEQISKFRRKKN